MKKIFVIMVAVFATAIAANAQDSKWYAGGALQFQSVSYDGESNTAFGIVPEVGYRLNEKFAVGVALGFETEGKGDEKYNAFAIKPYVRHTLTSWGDVDLFLDYGVSYANGGYKDAKVNEFSVGIAPGVAYNATDKLSFVAKLGNGLGYTYSKPDVDGAKATSTFGLDLNSLQVQFGVYFNF